MSAAALRPEQPPGGKAREWLQVALDRVVVPGMLVLVAIATGAAFIHLRYGRDLVDSFYFAVIMLATVGYGEFSFPDVQGRLFACFWLLFGTGTVASCMVAIAGLPLELRRRKIVARAVARQGLHQALLEEVGGRRGAVDRFDWLCFMLKGLGKVDDGEIALVMEQFEALDHNGNGVLDYTDLLRSQFISRRASSGEGPWAGGSSRGGGGGSGGVGRGGGAAAEAAAEDAGLADHPSSSPAEGSAGPAEAAEAAKPGPPGAAIPRNFARARSSVMAPGESWVVGPIVGVPLPQQGQRAVSL